MVTMRNTLVTYLTEKNIPNPNVLNELQKLDLRDVVIVDRHVIIEREKVMMDILMHNSRCDINNPNNEEGYNMFSNLITLYNK